MAEAMAIEPAGEKRTDVAERYLDLDNAPVLDYVRTGFGRRQDSDVRWQPTRATLRWDRGVLHAVRVSGYRLKKNGDIGLIRETDSFNVVDGKVALMISRQYPTEWVQQIVDLYGKIPALPKYSKDRPAYAVQESAIGPHTIIRA